MKSSETKNKSDALPPSLHLFWPLLLGITLLLQHAWVRGFFSDGDLYAILGKNAAEKGAWLIPHLSEAYYPEFFQHPPLLFITEGLFFKIFPATYLSARLFSAGLALLTAFFLFSFLSKRNLKTLAYFSGVLLFLMPPFLRTSRYPNFEVLLSFLFCVAFLSYYKALFEGEKKYWWLTGLCFGLSLLTKGPPALLIPLICFIHASLNHSLVKLLKSAQAWGGLVLGILLFLLWPFLLIQTGHFSGFQSWFTTQVLRTVVEGRGKTDLDLFAYFTHLLKNTPLWLLFSFIALFRFKKNKLNRPLFTLFTLWYLLPLILFSFVKFKYMHYIYVIYLPYALVSATFIDSLSETLKTKISSFLKPLILLTTLALLIFPLTTQSRRNSELFRIHDYLGFLQNRPKTVELHFNEGDLPWEVVNFLAFNDYEIKVPKQGLFSSELILIHPDELKLTPPENLSDYAPFTILSPFSLSVWIRKDFKLDASQPFSRAPTR